MTPLRSRCHPLPFSLHPAGEEAGTEKLSGFLSTSFQTPGLPFGHTEKENGEGSDVEEIVWQERENLQGYFLCFYIV